MKKLLSVLFALSAVVTFISCDYVKPGSQQISSDAITDKLHLVDSVLKSAPTSHIESWEIGRLTDNGFQNGSEQHSVIIYLSKLSTSTDTISYLEFNYCETPTVNPDKRVTKFVLLEELPAIYAAIDDIKQHYGTYTDHFEYYNYLTSSSVSLSLTRFLNEDIWEIRLCSIELSREDLDQYKRLLNQAESHLKYQ